MEKDKNIRIYRCEQPAIFHVFIYPKQQREKNNQKTLIKGSTKISYPKGVESDQWLRFHVVHCKFEREQGVHTMYWRELQEGGNDKKYYNFQKLIMIRMTFSWSALK